MSPECKISDERWSDKDSFVYFTAELDGEVKTGYISCEAIGKIPAAFNTDWQAAFDEVRGKLQKMAYEKWRANPLNEMIVIGAGDL